MVDAECVHSGRISKALTWHSESHMLLVILDTRIINQEFE